MDNVEDKQPTLKEIEITAIKQRLTFCNYNVSKTALSLGINRATLNNKLKRMNGGVPVLMINIIDVVNGKPYRNEDNT